MLRTLLKRGEGRLWRQAKGERRKARVWTYGVFSFILLFALVSLVYVAIAATTNVNSVPQLSTNPTDISPQNVDGFNDTTTISYSLETSGYSNVKIYSNASSTTPLRDLLTNSFETAGAKSSVWDGKDNSALDLPNKLDYSVKYDGVSFRSILTSGMATNPGQIAIDNSTTPATIFAIRLKSGSNGALLRSTDGGATWLQINYGGVDPRGVTVIRTGGTPPTGYEGTGQSLFPTVGDATNQTIVFVSDGNSDAPLGGGGNKYYPVYYTNNGGLGSWSSKALTPLSANPPKPFEIAVDPLGQVYGSVDGNLSDGPDKLVKFYWDSDAGQWKSSSLGFAFGNPKGIAIENSGTIYVADQGAGSYPSAIYKSTDGGNSFSSLMGSGSSNGQVSQPQGLFFENGKLWITEVGNNRVQQVYSNGSYIQTVGSAQAGYNLVTPRGVGVDGNDNLIISDSNGNRINRYIRDNIVGPNIGIDNDSPLTANVYQVASGAGTGIYHKGNVTITADAFDDGVGIGWVEFYEGLNLLGVDNDPAGGWTFNWATDPFGADDGPHDITVKVYDSVYNQKTSGTTSIVVDNLNPTAQITDPGAGSYKKGFVPIIGTADDNNIQNYVVEYDDGVWQEITTSNNGKNNETLANWDTTGKNGSYTVRVRVTDLANNTASASVTFNVDNTPPDNVTTGNASNSPFSPGIVDGNKDDTTINLTANDNNGLDGTTSWTLVFRNLGNSVVRTYSGTGSPANQVWDGKDDGGFYVPDSQYSYVYSVTDKAGNITSTAQKWVTVDNTGPAASIGGPSNNPFSPNADGVKDTTQLGVISSSDTSAIVSWDIKIYDKDDLLIPVRTISGAGNPNGSNQVWDGLDDLAGALPDDTYRYKLTVTDDAGNSTITGLNDVVMDTTGPVASTSNATNDPFSPNADAVKDTTSVDLTSSDANGIASYELTFHATDTKSFSGAGDPNGTTKVWVGDKDPSGNATNGTYTYELKVTDNAGNQTISASKTVKLDLTLPAVSIGGSNPDPFSPNGDGTKDTTQLGLITASDANGITSWNIKIYDKDNLSVPVRTISGAGDPNGSNQVWDGKNDAAVVVPDDMYKYKITVTDGAGNQNSTDNSNAVTVDNTGPAASIGGPSNNPFSPNADGTKDTTQLGVISSSDSSAITSWNIKIFDKDNLLVPVRTISGAGNPNGSNQVWDGLDDLAGALPDDTYRYELTVTDGAGNSTTTGLNDVVMDTIGPVASTSNATNDPFSPNADGTKDTTSVDLTSSDANGIASYELTFHATDTKSFSGAGDPNGTTKVWVGDKDPSGNATNGTYTYELKVTDNAGNQTISASKTVTLDIVAPNATVDPANPAIFSPKQDGSVTTSIGVSASDVLPETLDPGNTPWVLTIKNSSNITVREYSGTVLPASIDWNGKADDNPLTEPVPGGIYKYKYTVTDKAGNKGISNEETVTVDRTGPVVSIGNPSPSTFSPNGDLSGDTTDIGPMSATDPSGVASWKVEFRLSGTTAISRTILGGGDPSGNNVTWDGKDDGASYVADGVYEYIFKASDVGGNESATAPKTVNVDTAAPVISDDSVNPLYFSPNSDGINETVTVVATISDLSSINWTLRVRNQADVAIYSTSGSGNAINKVWDGKDILGNIQPDGTYKYEIEATDTGGNQSVDSVGNNFYLDTVKPTANAGLASNDPFSPNVDAVKDDTSINLTGLDTSPITSWSLQIEDVSATPVRNYSGINATNDLNEVVIWDGKDNGGSVVPDGTYNYTLVVQDQAGNFYVAPQRSVVIDNTKPIINSVAAVPDYFAPDITGNGYKTSSFNINITDNLSSVDWTIKVKSPSGAYVRQFDGSGSSTTDIAQEWDGKDGSGVVQPDGQYAVEVYATDTAGNAANMQSSVVNVDSTKPVVDITNPLADSKLFGTVDITGTASDTNIDIYELFLGLGASPVAWDTVGSGNVSKTAESLFLWDTSNVGEDDNYTLKLQAKDLANNNIETNVIISIENKMLVATIDEPQPGEVLTGIQPIVGTATNTNTSMFKNYKIEVLDKSLALPAWKGIGGDSIPVVDGGLVDWDTTKMKVNGEYTIRVMAYDKAGNVIITTRDVFVDNASPVYGTITPANKSYVSGVDSEKIVIYDVFDLIVGMDTPTSSVELTIDDDPVEAIYDEVAKTVTYEPVGGFADGTYTATLNLIDKNGNELGKKAVTWTFTVDNTLPEADITSPLAGSTVKAGSPVPVIGTADDLNFSQYILEYKAAEATSWSAIAPLTGYFSKSKLPVNNSILSAWVTPLVDGQYDLRLSVYDKSGKMSQVVKNYTIDSAAEPSPVDGAEITSPDNSKPYWKGKITIEGSGALLTDFKRYEIYQRRIAPLTDSASTKISSSTIPVNNGKLAVWDTTGKNGTYELHIRVYDVNETLVLSTEGSPVVIDIDNAAPVYPKTFSMSPGNGSYTNLGMPTIKMTGIRDTEPILGKKIASGITDQTVVMRVDNKLVSASYDVIQSYVAYTPTEPLKDGKHRVTMRIKDVAGNAVSKLVKWYFTVDKGDIAAEITRPYNNEVIKGTFLVRGKAWSRNFASYEIQYYPLNDPKSNTTPQWKRLAAGKYGKKKISTLFKWKTKDSAWYKIRLIVKDKANNSVTTAPVTVQIDNLAPTIDIKAGFPMEKQYAKTPEGWDGTGVQVPVNDTLDKYYRPGSGMNKTRTIFKLNDTRYPTVFDDSDNTVNYKPAGGLPDGKYNASLTIFDMPGNKAVKNWWFVVDNTAPQANITYPAINDVVSTDTPVNGTAYDANILNYNLEKKLTFEDIWKSIYKAKSLNVTGPGTLAIMTLPDLDETYELRLTVTDKAGNMTVYPDPASPHIISVDRTQQPVYGSGIEIQSPENGMIFAGPKGALVPVVGSATDPDFKNYVVYSKQLSPVAGSETTVINSSLPRSNGTLASWSMGGKNGEFELGLKVYRKSDGMQIGATITKTVAIDSTPPVIASYSPANKSYVNNGRQPVTVSYTEPLFGMNPNAFKVYVDGFNIPLDAGNSSYDSATKTFVYMPSEDYGDGNHTVEIYGEDLAGFGVSSTAKVKGWNFTVDTNPNSGVPTPPEARIDYPVQDGFAGGAISVNGTAFDQNVLTYQLDYTANPGDPEPTWVTIGIVKGKPMINASLIKWDASKLANGTYGIKLTLIDKAGNVLTDQKTFNLDNGLPTALITDPNTTSNVLSGTYQIKGTADDPLGGNFDSYKLEYQVPKAATWNEITTSYSAVPGPDGVLANWNTTGVLNGVYTLKLTVKDKANNTSVTTFAIKIDNSAPEVSITSPSDEAWIKGSITVYGGMKDDNMLSRIAEAVEVDINGVPTGLPPITLSSGTTSILPINPITTWNTSTILAGRYKITATATDKAGLTTEVSVIVNVDNVLPDALVASPVKDGFVKGIYNIVGDADDTDNNIASYKLEYKVGTNAPILISENMVPPTSGINNDVLAAWDTTGGGLDETKTYTIILSVYDKAGNMKKHDLVTGVKVDNTSPTASITAPLDEGSLNVSPVTVTGTASDANNNILSWTVEYENQLTPGVWNTVSSGAANVTNGTLATWDTSVLGSGTYNLRLTVIDKASNQAQFTVSNLSKT